jgi:hypothetical protein
MCHDHRVTSDSEASSPASDRYAGWKWTLYALMTLQALSILAFVLTTFLHIPILLPFAVSYPMAGALALLGTLLWCSESAVLRPHLTRLGIRSALIGILLWAGCFFFLPLQRQPRSPERAADAQRAFQKLVAEAKLPAPASEPGFSPSGRHGEGFSFRYTDTLGTKQHILVRPSFAREWVFRSLSSPSAVTTPATD